MAPVRLLATINNSKIELLQMFVGKLSVAFLCNE